MTQVTYIQGGPGWRRVWRRRLGGGRGAITVLNGQARDYGVRDPDGAFSIKWAPRGRIVYRTEGASHVLSGEHAVILNQAQPYELEFADRGGAESLCVFFSDDLVAEAWKGISRPDRADDPDPAGPALTETFPDLVFRPSPAIGGALAGLREGYGAADPSELAAEERFLELLAGLMRAAHAHRLRADRIPAVKPSTRRLLAARLERARERIEYSMSEPSLDQIADASALSKFHLLRLFKAAFGCTPSAYWRARRLDRGRRLLRATPMTVAEIAGALGYENASAFIRAFRRHFGTTPQAIRV
jgi:AraC-like DNA-binding protein